LLTQEVNAACEGLFEAGVTEILVNDAHGAGRTILYEELIAGVTLARGQKRPYYLIGFGPRFDALVQVGMHAMTNTPNACLCHTMSWGQVYRFNEQEVGEMQMVAYVAGQFEIPWLFTSGDSHACREAEAWVPGMVCAPVKEGLSEECAIHLAPDDAYDLIFRKATESVETAERIEPLQIEGPVTLEIERDSPWPKEERIGAERVNDHTLRFVGETPWQVLNLAIYGLEDWTPPEE
jgi:D-amino peptidase